MLGVAAGKILVVSGADEDLPVGRCVGGSTRACSSQRPEQASNLRVSPKR